MCGLCIICKNESQQHASANMLSFLQQRQRKPPPTMHHFDIHHKTFLTRSLVEIYNSFLSLLLAFACKSLVETGWLMMNSCTKIIV